MTSDLRIRPIPPPACSGARRSGPTPSSPRCSPGGARRTSSSSATPRWPDTAACEHYGYEPADSANTIIVATKEDPPRYAACVVLATHRLDVNKAVRKRFGARKVSFADPEQTKALTGMLIGGVTAVGLPDDLPLWVDAAVMGP